MKTGSVEPQDTIASPPMLQATHRLPRNVVPTAYEIDLKTSPRRKGFSGSLVATVVVKHPTAEVVLHGSSLKIVEAFARRGRRKLLAKARVDGPTQTIRLRFDEPLPEGEATITLHYTGKLSAGLNGLYLARNGKEVAVASQCEAAEARAIFPCWDEPDRKATLQWTVRTDPGLTVVTNGVPRSARRDPKTGLVVHRFKATPVLSTYLAAVTVGRFDATEPRDVGGVPCRVLAMEGRIDQAAFAQDVTAFVLPWFTRYFKQRYHYGKLDQVGLPAFDAGAMENAGAIFYRQQRLLMDEATTSWRGQKAIAETIAHEIAHQWFGNRVTLAWWDDLWLNEAFATWISHKAVDEWKPDWRIWDDFQPLRRHALALDSLETTHPIYTPVESPAEATEMFDAITYHKGCCVLRQLEAWVGPDPFRDGLRSYLQKFKDRNAVGSDLWDAIARTSGVDVAAFASSWTTQEGFPLVAIDAEERKGLTVLHLSQRRFFSRPEAMAAGSNHLWSIPLRLRWSDEAGAVHIETVLLDTKEAEHQLPGRAAWIHGNADGVGFYRTALSPTLSSKLAAASSLQALSAVERQILLDDQWAQVLCGRATIDSYLDFLAGFRDERDYVVLEALVERLDVLVNRVASKTAMPALRRLVRDLLHPAYEALGWGEGRDEDPARAAARAAVIAGLGELARDEDTLRQAAIFAKGERESPSTVDPNLAAIAVRLCALQGSAKLLDTYVSEYRQRRERGAAPEEQLRYLDALAAFEKPALTSAVLELSLGDTIPQESMTSLLRSLLMRPSTAERSWRFLQERWREVLARAGLMQISRLIEGLGALPLSRKHQIESFFAKNPIPEARRALAQALQEIELYDELRRREGPRLEAWLASATHLVR